MKIVLVFVATLDGKITKWGDPKVKAWSSKSDQKYFKKIWNYSRLIVMGSNTYNADRVKPSVNHHYVVMTRDPASYTKLEVPEMVEFRSESPSDLAAFYENQGYERMLVVGGPHVAASFLREQMIDEVWLTIEPLIFGSGGNFVSEEKLDIHLRLLDCEKANRKGTLITKYAVVKR